MMGNHEKLRDEEDSRVAAERTHRRADGHPAEGALAPKPSENRPEARARYIILQIVNGPAYRLANASKQIEREQKPRCTGGKECVTPPVMFGDPPTAEVADKQSNVEPGRIERQRGGTFLRRIQIREHGIDRGTGPRLA